MHPLLASTATATAAVVVAVEGIRDKTCIEIPLKKCRGDFSKVCDTKALKLSTPWISK